MSEDDFESRLARLADATNDVRPRGDFTARVMQAVEADGASAGRSRRASGFFDDFLVPARRLLPVAALAAALALVWAIKSDHAFDDAAAGADDAVEVEW